MKNIQIIDGAINATFSIFQATNEEYDIIFPGRTDIEFIEEFVARVGDKQAVEVLSPIWERPILKLDVQGIHGTLFYNWLNRRQYYPETKREIDTDELSINEAQRRLFRSRQ
jgi:hypothetical protein